MRYLLFICIYSLTASLCMSQQVEIPLFFEDNVGNQDTLIIGYDNVATTGVDSIFGEVNIISNPFDSVFEVRISDEWFNRNSQNPPPTPGTFHIKKQIIPTPQQGHCWMIEIDFVCQNWPMTVRWDNSQFQDSTIQESVISDYHPGGWFDVGPWEISTCMRPDSMETFEAKPPDYYLKYADSFNDSIISIFVGSGYYCSAFPFACGLNVGIEETQSDKSVVVFPNPTTGTINIHADADIDKIQIQNQHGKLIRDYENTSTIDIHDLANGIYYLIFNRENERAIKKIIITGH